MVRLRRRHKFSKLKQRVWETDGNPNGVTKTV